MRYLPEHADRFLQTLAVVEREVRHLVQTQERLFAQPVDTSWVSALETNIDLAERVEAFVSRYGRLQDTIGEKLLPRLARLEGESPKALIDTLNWAERLGLIADAAEWIALRNLRNKLIHEYMGDAAEFAATLNAANAGAMRLIDAYKAIAGYGEQLGLRLPARE